MAPSAGSAHVVTGQRAGCVVDGARRARFRRRRCCGVHLRDDDEPRAKEKR